MPTVEKYMVTDECTALAVIENHRETIQGTLNLLSNYLDAIVAAWSAENAAALDNVVNEALETVPASVEEASECLEELAAHVSELEEVIAHLKLIYAASLTDERTPGDDLRNEKTAEIEDGHVNPGREAEPTSTSLHMGDLGGKPQWTPQLSNDEEGQ